MIRQLLLPESVCKQIRITILNCDLSDMLHNNFQTITIKKFLWRPEVETYMSVYIDNNVHKEITDEAIKRKVDSNLLIRNILFKCLR